MTIKMIKNMCAAIVCLWGATMFTACSKDEFSSRGDLFQPRFASDPAVTVKNNNDISIVWYKSNDACSYTVQVFTDYYYQNLYLEQETTDSYIVLEDLPYGTRFYVRVRCNADDPQHNSQWALANFTTEPRPDYNHIVHGVAKSEIENTAAVIRWDVTPTDVADSISVSPAMNKELGSVTRMLTATEQAQGWVRIEGLTPNTLYSVNLYNTAVTRQQDKPYNTVNFRTTGPAPQTIEVGITDDLSALLQANNDDPTIPEGTEYSLPEGATYTIAPYEVKKGFRIAGPETGSKPILVVNGSWRFASGAYVAMFAFRNVEIRNQSQNQYFFNCGNSYDVEEVSFTNVDFRNIYRGFWRHQASNVKHIQSLEIEGCRFDQCGWQGACYGTFNFGSAGKGEIGQYDQIDQMVIRNCTFSRGGSKQDPSWGWGNLIAHNSTSLPINLIVENVTFYDFCVNQRLIDISNTEKSTVEIRSVVIASPMGEILAVGSGTKTSFQNNFTTTDYQLGGGQIRATELTESAADLFVNPDEGDYTLKSQESAISKAQAGDSRWIVR